MAAIGRDPTFRSYFTATVAPVMAAPPTRFMEGLPNWGNTRDPKPGYRLSSHRRSLRDRRSESATAVASSAVGPPRNVPKIRLPSGSTLPTYASEQGCGSDPTGKTLMKQVPPPPRVCGAPAVTGPVLPAEKKLPRDVDGGKETRNRERMVRDTGCGLGGRHRCAKGDGEDGEIEAALCGHETFRASSSQRTRLLKGLGAAGRDLAKDTTESFRRPLFSMLAAPTRDRPG